MTEVTVYSLYDDGDFSDEVKTILDDFAVTKVKITNLFWVNKNVSFVARDKFSIKRALTVVNNGDLTPCETDDVHQGGNVNNTNIPSNQAREAAIPVIVAFTSPSATIAGFAFRKKRKRNRQRIK